MADIMDALIHIPLSLRLIAVTVIFSVVYAISTRVRPVPGLPVATIKLPGLQRWLPEGLKWTRYSRKIIQHGLEQYSGCFQVKTMSGYKIILPSHFADELSSNPSLSLVDAFKADYSVCYPNFKDHHIGFSDDTVFPEIVRIKLTRSLPVLQPVLIEEATDSIRTMFGEDREWQNHNVRGDSLHIIARLTARILLGSDVGRNEEWLEIARNYTTYMIIGSRQMRLVPTFSRPLIYWLLPSCMALRRIVRKSGTLILPEVRRRHKEIEDIMRAGGKPTETADGISWMIETARGKPIDYVTGQLTLSIAATHETTELMTHCIVQFCDTPEVVQPLRDEVIEVLSQNGWGKTSMYKMKLMDSFLKEVQRIRQLPLASFNRVVKETVTLSDGTVLPVGSRIMISTDKARDPTIYHQPGKFDFSRYLSEESRDRFVTASTDQMGFGYGQHACPGRFFVSDLLKVSLSFMLLKYDFRCAPGKALPKSMEIEHRKGIPNSVEIQLRRRQEEIDLLMPIGLTEYVN